VVTIAVLPSYRTWVAGEVVTAAYFNTNIRDAGNFWLSRPLAILRQASGQSISNNTWTAITLDTEDLNRDSGHSLVTNPSRYTSQTTGYYLCSGAVAHGFNATAGARGAEFATNGAAVNYTASLVPQVTTTWGSWVPISAAFLYLTATTQYVEIWGFQNSGGAVTTTAGSNLHVLWVSS
jgi:hypothetical protein